MKCSCGGAYEHGFIPDFGWRATWTAVWMPGEPSLQKGLMDRLRTGAGISSVGDAKMIEAERCHDCGNIQLFARKAAPAGATPGT